MTTSPDVLDSSPKADTAARTAAGAESPDSVTPLPSATLGGEKRRSVEQIALLLFITLPFVALVAAVPLAWGWG